MALGLSSSPLPAFWLEASTVGGDVRRHELSVRRPGGSAGVASKRASGHEIGRFFNGMGKGAAGHIRLVCVIQSRTIHFLNAGKHRKLNANLPATRSRESARVPIFWDVLDAYVCECASLARPLMAHGVPWKCAPK